MSFMMGMTESPEGFDDEISDYEEAPAASGSNKRSRKSGAAAGPASKAKGKAAKKDNGTGSHNNDDNAASADPASARKLQNRTAQREFRQRKLQYVKDLEARVEFLSSPKDEQLEILKALVYGLLEENKELRTLTQNLSKCIGEGIGSLTSRLGFSGDAASADLDEFINRGEKDTLHKLYTQFQEHRKSEMVKGAAGNPSYSPLTKLPGAEQGKPDSPPTTTKANSRSGSRKSSPAPLSAGSTRKESSKSKKPTPDNASPVTAHGQPMQPVPQAMQAQTQHHQQPPQQQLVSQYQPYQPINNGQQSLSNSHPASADGYSPPGAADQSLMRSKPQSNVFPFSNMTSPAGAVSFSNFLPGTNTQSQDFTQMYGQQLQNFSMPAANNGGGGDFQGLFFEGAEPASMPTAAFTNNFISEYYKTGLTPSLAYGDLQNFDWGLPFNPDTPSSSTSSGNVQQQQQQQSYARAANGKDNEATQAFYRDYAARAEAAGRFRLPNGITPDEVISSNPILTLIHCVSQHMRAKAADPDYEMPEPLRPTSLQMSTPHDFRIDGMLSGPIRDSLILNADKYDSDEFFRDCMACVTLHPPTGQHGLLDYGRIEFSELFFRKYKHIVTPDLVDAANYWRRSRGEPELRF